MRTCSFIVELRLPAQHSWMWCGIARGHAMQLWGHAMQLDSKLSCVSRRNVQEQKTKQNLALGTGLDTSISLNFEVSIKK